MSSNGKAKTPYLKYAWRVFVGLVYLGVVVGILSVATTKFETILLAVLVQLYAVILDSFSVLGSITDVNNYAGFVRFRILATAQGITENEDGLFTDQERALAEAIDSHKTSIVINRVANLLVSLYALFKIALVIFSS